MLFGFLKFHGFHGNPLCNCKEWGIRSVCVCVGGGGGWVGEQDFRDIFTKGQTVQGGINRYIGRGCRLLFPSSIPVRKCGQRGEPIYHEFNNI